MPISVPVYAADLSCWAGTTGQNNLASGYSVATGIFDQAVHQASDLQVSLKLVCAAAGYVGLYLLPSHDGVQWGYSGISSAVITAGTAISTAISSILPAKEIAVFTPTESTFYWTDTIAQYVGNLPRYFTILVLNQTGQATASTNGFNQCIFTPISYEYI